ncbi:hypothetical protein Tco_0540145 [Tanacetum coccineum]
MKNAGKFLKTKSDFDILNDKSDGEGSIQVTNKTDTFVELKNKYRSNFLVDIEKIIKSNRHESGAKVRLVLKGIRKQWREKKGLAFLSIRLPILPVLLVKRNRLRKLKEPAGSGGGGEEFIFRKDVPFECMGKCEKSLNFE